MTDTTTKLRDELLKDLEDDGDEYFSGGRFNNIVDIVLSASAILSSLAATVLATTEVCRWIAATVAALPAACASIQRVMNVRGRASWYFRHAALVRALAMDLRYASAPNLQEVAQKRGNIEVEMEKEWDHALSPGGAKPKTNRGRSKGS
jgi:hypothetical protein